MKVFETFYSSNKDVEVVHSEEILQIQTSERFLRSAGPRQNSLKIVGSVIFSVKVYVKLNHNSPRILCLTNHLQNSELIDPIFQWNGPGGSLSSENSSVQISPTGTLILRHFNLRGVYTCSIVYKLIATQPDKNLTIKYLTYAYSDPKIYYEFTARYRAAPCNSSHNTSFEKELLQILSKLVAELSCEVTRKSERHDVKMQRGGLQNEILTTFSAVYCNVSSGKQCSSLANYFPGLHHNTLALAKDLIERFFTQQGEVSRQTEPLPEIGDVEGTLQTVWADGCYPGYGMNASIHPDCPKCCVICSPGSYNPSDGIHCLRCNSSLSVADPVQPARKNQKVEPAPARWQGQGLRNGAATNPLSYPRIIYREPQVEACLVALALPSGASPHPPRVTLTMPCGYSPSFPPAGPCDIVHVTEEFVLLKCVMSEPNVRN
ncbi:LOW QUALITY PROTEIN: zona pellucida-binding protein 1 [Rhynochetos jubatus]